MRRSSEQLNYVQNYFIIDSNMNLSIASIWAVAYLVVGVSAHGYVDTLTIAGKTYTVSNPYRSCIIHN